MNRAWMDCAPGTVEYRMGVLHFLSVAFAGRTHDEMKPCPCRKCVNSVRHDWATIYDHMMVNGILRDYRIWQFHGYNVMSSGLELSSKRRKLHSHSGQMSLVVMDRLQKIQEKLNEMEAQWHAKIGQMIMQNQQLKNLIHTTQSTTHKPAEGSRAPELLPRWDKPTMESKSHVEVVDQGY